jgi:hypothetical protein
MNKMIRTAATIRIPEDLYNDYRAALNHFGLPRQAGD